MFKTISISATSPTSFLIASENIVYKAYSSKGTLISKASAPKNLYSKTKL